MSHAPLGTRAQSRAHRSVPRRRPLFLIALSVLLIVGLACMAVVLTRHSPDSSASQGLRPIEGALTQITVSGRVGATPVLALKTPVSVGALKAQDVETGMGRQITEGSPVLLSVTSFDGTSGTMTSPSGRPSLLVAEASGEALGAEIAELVIGRREGTRVLALHPLADEPGNQADRTQISVIDILPSIATGTPPSTHASGALTVTMTPEGPVITHVSSEPSGLEVQTLLEGQGEQVGGTDRIVAQYTVVGWTDSHVRASTWQTGMPELIALADAMRGLREAVTDRRVGSRLAVTIPADLATGDDALCVVIDILGTESHRES